MRSGRLALLNKPITAGANWHAFGTCNYHVDPNGDEAFELKSQSSCRQYFYGGTGYWLSTFSWENGNVVEVVFNLDDSGTQSLQVNGEPSLLSIELVGGSSGKSLMVNARSSRQIQGLTLSAINVWVIQYPVTEQFKFHRISWANFAA